MAYYPDFSPYEYGLENAEPLVLNIGWLSKGHGFSQGIVLDIFIERLWAFCREPMRQSKGFHECEFCTEPNVFGITVQHDGEELRLGSAEIRVLDKGDVMYAAPNLIYHYAVEHHYCPPEKFIQAVLASPLPNEPEYRTRTSKWKYGSWRT